MSERIKRYKTPQGTWKFKINFQLEGKRVRKEGFHSKNEAAVFIEKIRMLILTDRYEEYINTAKKKSADDKYESFKVYALKLFRKKKIKGPALVIALSERIKCAIANDSGTAHMIDSGGAPIIKVFGRSLPGKYTGLTPGSLTIDSRIFGSTDINEIAPKYVIKKIEKFFK